MITADRLLTVQQLADVAGLDARVIRRDIALEQLGALRVGRRELRILPREALRYCRDDLQLASPQLRRLGRLRQTKELAMFIDLADLAWVLQVSTQHLRNAVHDGRLTAHCFRSRIVIHSENAWAFLMRLDRVGRISPLPDRSSAPSSSV